MHGGLEQKKKAKLTVLKAKPRAIKDKHKDKAKQECKYNHIVRPRSKVDVLDFANILYHKSFKIRVSSHSNLQEQERAKPVANN